MVGAGGKDNVGSRERGGCETGGRLVDRLDASQRGLNWAMLDLGEAQVDEHRRGG
jgi:hypothetical protein